ncbi:MAG TPA: flagellar biosynthesis protein FliQ [Tepidimicrobium sp.]|nr:flagellar biosynthesis protein FliQ [Tepidimicrobium sp.]
MEHGNVLKLAQDATRTILMMAAPMLIFSLIVGLVVSIFQAVTQIQEATLAFIPKIIAVFISIIIFGPWILKIITQFTTELFNNINLYIK